MEMREIVDQIDAQIARLQKVRTLLADTAAPSRRKPGRPSGSGKVLPPAKVNAVGAEKVAGKPSPVRTLSAEARQRMATAQRARWAKSKAASKKAAKKPVRKTEVTAVAKPTKPKTAAPKTTPVKKATSVKKAGVRKGETAPVAAV
jgi:chorismate mutase